MPVINSAKQNIINNIAGGKFAKRSFLLITSQGTRMLAQIVIIFIYSRHLSFKEYGAYQSVWLYVNVISTLSLFGLPSLIMSASQKNIYTSVKDNKKHFFIAGSIVNFLPLLFLLLAVHEFSIGSKLLIIMLIICQNISILAEAITIKKEKEMLLLISNIIFAIGYFACHIFILYTGYSLELLVAVLILIFAIKATTLLWLNKQNIEDPVNTLSPTTGRQWFYLGVVDSLSVLFKWIDKWIILFFLSVSQFAIYFNGSYEIPVLGLMVSGVGNIMLIELSKHSHKSSAASKILFTNSSLLLASIVFPSFAFLLFYHSYFFTFIFSAKYVASIPIFFVSIFILPVRITNYGATLQVYNRNDLVVKGALIDIIIAVILMAFLYPFMGMKGLALAFVISTYIQAWYYLWHTSNLINQKIVSFFPLKKLLLLMVISILLLGTTYAICNRLPYPLNMIIGVAVCSLLIISLLYLSIKRSNWSFLS